MNSTYNIVLSTSESTVVTEYVPEKKRSDAYQSEAALEDAFIKLLSEQGYEYLQIHDTNALDISSSHVQMIIRAALSEIRQLVFINL